MNTSSEFFPEQLSRVDTVGKLKKIGSNNSYLKDHRRSGIAEMASPNCPIAEIASHVNANLHLTERDARGCSQYKQMPSKLFRLKNWTSDNFSLSPWP